jgi:integrase
MRLACHCKPSEAISLRSTITILTASRSNEVRDMEWREVDLVRRVWTIPAVRMKARREHVVPLTGEALAIHTDYPPGTAEGVAAAGAVSGGWKRGLKAAIIVPMSLILLHE